MINEASIKIIDHIIDIDIDIDIYFLTSMFHIIQESTQTSTLQLLRRRRGLPEPGPDRRQPEPHREPGQRPPGHRHQPEGGTQVRGRQMAPRQGQQGCQRGEREKKKLLKHRFKIAFTVRLSFP